MDSIFIFIFAAWGLTHLLVSGRILDKFRNWIMVKSKFLNDLLTCYQCTGFWAGLLVSSYFTTNFLHMVLMALISSGICPIINSIYIISSLIRLIKLLIKFNKFSFSKLL